MLIIKSLILALSFLKQVLTAHIPLEAHVLSLKDTIFSRGDDRTFVSLVCTWLVTDRFNYRQTTWARWNISFQRYLVNNWSFHHSWLQGVVWPSSLLVTVVLQIQILIFWIMVIVCHFLSIPLNAEDHNTCHSSDLGEALICQRVLGWQLIILKLIVACHVFQHKQLISLARAWSITHHLNS